MQRKGSSHNQRRVYRKPSEKEAAKKEQRRKEVARAMEIRSRQASVTVRGKGGKKA